MNGLIQSNDNNEKNVNVNFSFSIVQFGENKSSYSFPSSNSEKVLLEKGDEYEFPQNTHISNVFPLS